MKVTKSETFKLLLKSSVAKTNKQVRYSSSRICVASSNQGQALNMGILDTAFHWFSCEIMLLFFHIL